MTDRNVAAEASMIIKSLQEKQTLTIDLAMLFEDPCGADEIALARALINLGRAVKPENRREMARFINEVLTKLT